MTGKTLERDKPYTGPRPNAGGSYVVKRDRAEDDASYDDLKCTFSPDGKHLSKDEKQALNGQQKSMQESYEATASGNQSAEANEPVDVNNWDLNRLIELPGIGVATAQKIMANRPYESLDQLEADVGSKALGEVRERLKFHTAEVNK